MKTITVKLSDWKKIKWQVQDAYSVHLGDVEEYIKEINDRLAYVLIKMKEIEAGLKE